MGNIGVHSISWENNRCELGYWILGKHQGSGFVSDAVKTLEKMLFEIGFHRIEIQCDPANVRSAAVPLRNGYQFEGVLRDRTLECDRYRDSAMYAKLSENTKNFS
jgi:ribosomal-protein-serine acetyltransferase